MPNEATNFREAVAENLRDVFLGQNHGEEPVTYVPTEGDRREVVVRVLEYKATPKDGTHGRTLEHSLKFLVERHATRGIDDPRDGAGLYRGPNDAYDPDALYDFSEVVAEDPIGGAYVLRFVRDEIVQAGPNIPRPL